MKKPWVNPVMRPAKDSTMNTEGNLDEFTVFMKNLMSIPADKLGAILRKGKS
jgi:hypothetical protein